MPDDSTQPAPEFSFPITLGPDRIECEPIGTFVLDGKKFGHAVLNKALIAATIATGGLIPRNITDAKDRYVDGIVETLQAQLPEWLRAWLTSIVQWQTHVGTLNTAKQFLDWLEAEAHHLHLVLGVPSVQTWIRKIQTAGSASHRKRFGTIMAHRWNGRARRAPDDVVLYHEWQTALHLLENAREQRWEDLAAANPILAQAIQRTGLDSQLCSCSDSQLSSLAYRWVGKVRGLSAQTVEQRVGRVRARRASHKKPADSIGTGRR